MIPTDESTFLSHDLRLLESIELKQRIKHIVEIIEEVNWQDIDPDTVTRYVGFLLLVADNLSSILFVFLSIWGGDLFAGVFKELS